MWLVGSDRMTATTDPAGNVAGAVEEAADFGTPDISCRKTRARTSLGTLWIS